MAYKVVVLTGACLVAVLSPVSLGAELLAPRPGVARPALAPAVDGVARRVVVTVALVRAVGPESALGARLAAVGPAPPAPAAALAIHVEALGAVLTIASPEASPAVRPLWTGLHAEESCVAWLALALTGEEVAGSIA